MADFIDREDVLLLIDNGKLLSNASYKSVKNLINMLPAADVVTRDCYDLILYQNDIMIRQLASIGKHFGEKMDDVKPVAHGKWIELPPACNGALLTKCSACNRIFTDIQLGMVKHFCPNCGSCMTDE